MANPYDDPRSQPDPLRADRRHEPASAPSVGPPSPRAATPNVGAQTIPSDQIGDIPPPPIPQPPSGLMGMGGGMGGMGMGMGPKFGAGMPGGGLPGGGGMGAGGLSPEEMAELLQGLAMGLSRNREG